MLYYSIPSCHLQYSQLISYHSDAKKTIIFLLTWFFVAWIWRDYHLSIISPLHSALFNFIISCFFIFHFYHHPHFSTLFSLLTVHFSHLAFVIFMIIYITSSAYQVRRSWICAAPEMNSLTRYRIFISSVTLFSTHYIVICYVCVG